MWFFVWLALCAIAATIAQKKGRSGIGFFILSLFLSPLVGIIAAIVASPDNEFLEFEQDSFKLDQISSGAKKKCHFCAELIRFEANYCRHCGKQVSSYKDRKKNPIFENITDDIPSQNKSIVDDGKIFQITKNEIESLESILTKAGYNLEKGEKKWIINRTDSSIRFYANSDIQLQEKIDYLIQTHQKERDIPHQNKKDNLKKQCPICGGTVFENELQKYNKISICPICFELKKQIENQRELWKMENMTEK